MVPITNSFHGTVSVCGTGAQGGLAAGGIDLGTSAQQTRDTTTKVLSGHLCEKITHCPRLGLSEGDRLNS